MADGDLLTFLSPSDLSSFSQRVEASDPYGIIGRSLAQWQPNYSNFNATESLATSFGKALLSGLASNYASNRAADQVSKVVNVLPQLQSNPYAVTTPEGVDESAFGLLRGNAVIKDYIGKAQSEAVKQKTLADFLQAVGVEGVKAQTVDPRDMARAIKSDTVEEFLTKEGGTAALDALKNPNSPQYKLNKEMQSEADARRKEISIIPSVSQFMTMQKGLPLVASFKDQDTKSSDVGFVYNYIKSLDEGAVRGEEIDMAAASNPLVLKYKNMFQGVFTGRSELTPTLKNKMYGELLGAQGNIYEQAKKDAQIVADIAKSRGVVDNVYPFDIGLTFTPAAAGQQVASPVSGMPVAASDAQNIIAAVKAQYSHLPVEEQKAIAKKEIEKLRVPTYGGSPVG